MKRLLRIFELSKNEQRVVLIVMFILIGIALVQYRRRVDHFPVQYASAREAEPSATPTKIEDERRGGY